jgi:hypothetical protein
MSAKLCKCGCGTPLPHEPRNPHRLFATSLCANRYNAKHQPPRAKKKSRVKPIKHGGPVDVYNHR